MSLSLRESPHLSRPDLSQQVVLEGEVEEVVGVAPAVYPLGTQLQDLPVMLDSQHPTSDTVPGLQHHGPGTRVRGYIRYTPGLNGRFVCLFIAISIMSKYE